MANQRRFASRKILAWIVILGLGSLAAISWIARDALLERWYLMKLESDDVVVQDNACHALGRLKSSLAVPRLLVLMKERPGNAPFLTPPGYALCEVGKGAVELVIEELESFQVDPGEESIFLSDEELDAEKLYSLSLEHVLERIGAEAAPALGRSLERVSEELAGTLVSLLRGLGSSARPAIL
ncbi:MAG: hypothetical protein AAF517_13420, partial [Planctomycetota bacterium]